jgi:hypothetical protein
MNAQSICPGNDSEDSVPLAGAQGELLSVSIEADPRDLEDLLDRLGQSQYPIDPQIYHDAQIDGRTVTLVEFPAYPGWVDEIRKLVNNREPVTIRRCMTHAVSN